MAEVYVVKLLSDGCHWTLLVISQHWFRQWLGAVRQQAIIRTSVDQDLQRHMASLGPSELTSINKLFPTKWNVYLATTMVILLRILLKNVWMNFHEILRITYTVEETIFENNFVSFFTIYSYIYSGDGVVCEWVHFRKNIYSWLFVEFWRFLCHDTYNYCPFKSCGNGAMCMTPGKHVSADIYTKFSRCMEHDIRSS